jgi:folate-binding protein YgfZ
MNSSWKNFLLTQAVDVDTDAQAPAAVSRNNIYPLSQLAVLSIGGHDAAQLLQGQITCNINELSEEKSSLGALCNPKGRVIATFLLVKTQDAFLMVLPRELLEGVKKRLQMYILRSAVTLTDRSDTLCLIGLRPAEPQAEAFSTQQLPVLRVDFFRRLLIIAEPAQAMAFWSAQIAAGFQPQTPEQWRYLDMLSGVPWLTTATSEQFIPQMLNLDKLGGISFNKGCYTGQEIVARTHYLGKAKRVLFLAECTTSTPPAVNAALIDNSGQTLGTVVSVHNQQTHCTLLVVLPLSDTGNAALTLNDANQTPLTLLTFSS